ncbi:MAG: NUDIX hydrolase [Acidobacteria bacterium]|nr:MAG: NUDIX hydrolase [Acidobacteriota bacterium]
MKPEVVASELIYKGRVFDVLLAKVAEGNVTYSREIVLHNGSAVIVPIFSDGTIGLVRQYRHAAGKYLLEIPAGSIEENETPEQCAIRELREEIGVSAGKLEKLTEFFVSPGFLSEKMFVYIASDLTHIGQDLEYDELIQVERLDFPTIFKMITNGEFEDAKTMLSLILTGIKLGIINVRC